MRTRISFRIRTRRVARRSHYTLSGTPGTKKRTAKANVTSNREIQFTRCDDSRWRGHGGSHAWWCHSDSSMRKQKESPRVEYAKAERLTIFGSETSVKEPLAPSET